MIFRIACNVYDPAGNTSCSTKCPGIRAVSGKFQAFDTNAEIQYNGSWLKIGFLYANRRQLPARTSNAEPLRSSAMLFWVFLSLGSRHPVPNLLNNRIFELAIGRFHSEDAAIRNPRTGFGRSGKQCLCLPGQLFRVPVIKVAGFGLPKPDSQQLRLVRLTFPGLGLAGESLFAKGGDEERDEKTALVAVASL